jgi:hypothetical protein
MTANYELSHTIPLLLPYVSAAGNSYLWEYHYAKEYKVLSSEILVNDK